MSELKVPFDRSKAWPLGLVVGLNLIPVIGVLFWGWSAFALIVLYWLENLVIGVRTLASMIANAAVTGGVNWLGALFFGAFFTLHYGLFCFGHGIFVMALFGGSFYGDSIIDLGGAVTALFATQTNLAIGFASIVAWQVVQFIRFIVGGEVRRTNVIELMGAPYPRIIVLHISIIVGGFVLALLNQPVAGILVLALVKMGYDIADVLRDPKPTSQAADGGVTASAGAPPR
ncbi:MAG: DUF6498-containing protein [Hyphomonadaceae bacterium]